MIEYLSGEAKIGTEGECGGSSEESRRPGRSRRGCENSRRCRRRRFHWQLWGKRWRLLNEWRKAWYNRNGEDEAWSDPTYLWWRRRDWKETKREKRTLERLKCQGVRACLSLLIFYFYKIKLFFYIINYLIQFIA